jgi:hypothetical protein
VTPGFSPLRAGVAFLPFIAGVIVAANFVSNVGLARLGPKVVVPIGLLLSAAAAGWLTRIGVSGHYGLDVAPALVVVGLGTGCAVTVAFSLGPAGAARAVATATGHGDVVAFTVLIVLFVAGAVATGLLCPRRVPPSAPRGAS